MYEMSDIIRYKLMKIQMSEESFRSTAFSGRQHLVETTASHLLHQTCENVK
jgi:hypothetical protein